MLGESTEEVVGRERQEDVGEEAARARARKAGIAPSEKEVEDRKVDHAVFRSWCPRCVKGRVKSCGHAKKAQDEGAAPTVGVDQAHSGQEMEDEKGMPIMVARGDKTKTITSRSEGSRTTQCRS